MRSVAVLEAGGVEATEFSQDTAVEAAEGLAVTWHLHHQRLAHPRAPSGQTDDSDEASTYTHHMKGALFMMPTARVLANVVDQFDAIDMAGRDTKGDLYEYMLGKIATAGQNGQFRTPRHIIKLMV